MISIESLQAGLVIPIDKPGQWTSFQAVNKVKATIRRLYHIKNIKIGHAGTLDPLATGLLLICIGKATKRIEQLQSGEKEYTGTLVLGATTPCYDLERAVDHYYPTAHITPDAIEAARQGFVGDIEQVPPMYSAVKVAGQRAYVYARNDDPMAVIAPKTVHIECFELKKNDSFDSTVFIDHSDKMVSNLHLYNKPQGVVPEWLPKYDFRVVCGSGTYVRSLVHDLGQALGSGAFLAALRRERIGICHVKDAVRLEDIELFLKESCVENGSHVRQQSV